MTPKKSTTQIPGFTIRSFAIGLFALVISAILQHYLNVFDSWYHYFGDQTLGITAIVVFVAILIPFSIVYGLTKFSFLNKAEMLFILYALLIAGPIMSHGFWRPFLSACSTIPRSTDFDKLDVLSPKVWPHGENTVKNIFNSKSSHFSSVGNVNWLSTDIGESQKKLLPVVANTEPNITSSFRIKCPLKEVGILPGQLYLVSILARANDLGSQANYFCHIYYDTNSSYNEEVFISRDLESKNYVQRTGFVRTARYGIEVPSSVKDSIILEFGLTGEGTVVFDDPQLVNVSVLENAYKGKRLIHKNEYMVLPETERTKFVAFPEKVFSKETLDFIFKGYFPIMAWSVPVIALSSFLILLLIGLFSIAVIMRRQWVQNERYPLPMAQIPAALIGTDEPNFLNSIWRNRVMWIGFAIALFWCLIKLWKAFNPNVPNMHIEIPLKAYFADASWGKTWDGVNFTVYTLFLSLALFMELNILLSLVVGFLLYRMQFWFGEANGLVSNTAYPFQGEQMIGAYIAYAALILFFTRKYLWKVLKEAISPTENNNEVFSYRTALLVLVSTFIGVAIWARWIGASVNGLLLFFLFIMSIGFIASKLRSECGTPGGDLAPVGSAQYLALLIPLLGGISMFGASGTIIALILTFLIPLSVVIIPGQTLEFIELSRRVNMKKIHSFYAFLFGIIGAVVIGGWVYLAGMNSIGAQNMPRDSEFQGKNTAFAIYNSELTTATDSYFNSTASNTSSKPIEPGFVGMIIGGGITALLTIMRQLFAGFWFHPIGYIIGSSEMLNSAWGSIFLAWFIRFLVLKLGGAVTVRTKLMPFATGLFLGTIFAYVIAIIVNSQIYFFNFGANKFGSFF